MARRVSRFCVLAAIHLCAAAAITVMAAPPARADGLTLDVKARIAGACTFSASPTSLDLGTLVAGDEASASVTLTLTCASNSNVNIEIADGDTIQPRNLKSTTMPDGSNNFYIPYSLCTDAPSAGACAAWPSEGVNLIIDGAGSGTQDLYAYVADTDSEGKPAADYATTIIVTANYN